MRTRKAAVERKGCLGVAPTPLSLPLRQPTVGAGGRRARGGRRRPGGLLATPPVSPRVPRERPFRRPGDSVWGGALNPFLQPIGYGPLRRHPAFLHEDPAVHRVLASAWARLSAGRDCRGKAWANCIPSGVSAASAASGLRRGCLAICFRGVNRAYRAGRNGNPAASPLDPLIVFLHRHNLAGHATPGDIDR